MSADNAWIAAVLLAIILVQFLFAWQTEQDLDALRGMVRHLCKLNERMRRFIVEVERLPDPGETVDADMVRRDRPEDADVREEVL